MSRGRVDVGAIGTLAWVSGGGCAVCSVCLCQAVCRVGTVGAAVGSVVIVEGAWVDAGGIRVQQGAADLVLVSLVSVRRVVIGVLTCWLVAKDN